MHFLQGEAACSFAKEHPPVTLKDIIIILRSQLKIVVHCFAVLLERKQVGALN